MEKQKKENILHVRLGKKDPEDVKRLAVDIYGFDSVSEFVRYAIDFIEEHQPILGKNFAPGTART